jgi:hypothetical protein
MITPFPVTGVVYASNGTTKYHGVSVILRNITQRSSETVTTETDGSFAFDLANFTGGYLNGDSLKLEARIGSFYNYATLTVNTSLPGLDQSITLSTETLTGIIEFSRVKEELITFFRKKLTDPKARDSIEVSTQSGTGSQVKFELPRANAKYVDSVYIDGVLKTEYTNYYVDYNDSLQLSKPVVYFLSPPANGSIVEIKYCYGTSWVYPDVPRADLNIESYPRINLKFISVRTKEDGLGALGNITDILCSLQVWSANANELSDLINDARTIIMQNKKNLHYFKLMVPGEQGPVLIAPGREDKIIAQNQDFMLQFRLEVI